MAAMGQKILRKQTNSLSKRLERLRAEYSREDIRSILIVEDEYLIAVDVKEVLYLAGCPSIAMVANLPDAISMLRDNSPDAAILDLNLKGEMVFPVADILVERRIPFVFMTGHEGFVIPPRFSWVVRCQKPIEPVDAVMALLRSARRTSVGS